MRTEYKTYWLLVKIDGEGKWFEFPAVSLEAAMADIKAAVYGEVELITSGTR